MNKMKEEAIQKLRETLASGPVLIDENGNLISENIETKCVCCSCVLGNTEQDGFVSRYMVCPNCSYIQYVPYYKRVPPFWRYKIVDERGNDILDFKGDCRLFEGVNQANKYIEFCNMSEKWTSKKVDYCYGAE